MNLNEYEGLFLLSHYLLPAKALYPTQQNWKCLHVHNRQYTASHLKFWSRRSLRRKPRIFIPLGFDVQTNSDHKTQKIKPYSVRALKRYLNEKKSDTWSRNGNDFKI